MSSDPAPVSLFDVVRRAVDAADPDAGDARLGDLLARFEDDDEPVRGVEALDEVLAEAELDVDADGADPAVAEAIAVARYLAVHRGALGADDDHLLREATRWQWRGRPPQAVADDLAGRGIAL